MNNDMRSNGSEHLNADEPRASRLAEKNARIEEKNKRIIARGERIAKRNSIYFPQKPQEDIPPQGTSAESVPQAESQVNVTAPATITPPSPTKKSSRSKSKNYCASAAMILSAISILLLLSLFLGLTTGLIPIVEKAPAEDQNHNYSADTKMLEEFKNSVVIVSVERTTSTGTGTGIIFSSDGYIITNYHVVSDTLSIYVKLYGAEGYTKAELVGFSENDDVAVLKINKKNLRPAAFAESCADYLAGERVYAIGSPEGTDYSWSVTQGIISAVNRELKFYGNDGVMTKKWRVMQTDTPVNPGNSGGPLIDSNGVVVGMITSKLSENEGMGFALPADGVVEIASAIVDKGSADHIKSSISSGRPLIGVTCVSVEANVWYKNTAEGIEIVTEDYAALHPDNTFLPKESGVYVKYTDPSRDAYGKIFAEDIITKVNNTRVYTQYQMMDELYEFRGGDTVKLTVYRNGEYLEVSIVLAEAEIE